MLTGVVLIDKPEGPTSHDVVQAVRALTGERRCGHTGTLDPFATGLLPICLGRATRLSRFLLGAVKTYRAVVRFGFATDTYDATGSRRGPVVPDVFLERRTLEPILRSFVGKHHQVPPPFAAKRVRGQRMYRLARAGILVEPKAVEVTIRRVDLIDLQRERVTLDVEVESGTYIRSLAHDVGKRLGVGAHLEQLRRTRVGSLGLDRAVGLDELESLRKRGRLGEALLSPADALGELHAVRLGEQAAQRLRHGTAVPLGDVVELPRGVPTAQPLKLLDPSGALLGIGELNSGRRTIRPVVVLQPPDPKALSKTHRASSASGSALQAGGRVV